MQSTYIMEGVNKLQGTNNLQSRYKIGNAQTIGSFEVQSNYFSTLCLDSVFAVLADGTKDCKNGRKAAIIGVETSIMEFVNRPKDQDISTFFENLCLQIIKNINDHIYFGNKPNLSLCMTYLYEEKLYYYSVGDNNLFLYNGMDYIPLKDRTGHCNITSTDTVGLISKGIYQSLSEIELIKVLSKDIHPYDKSQLIIESINKKNIKMAGNSTIILIEGGL